MAGEVSEEVLRGIKRNEMLIDLTRIPNNIKDQVIDKYNEAGNGRQHLFDYFIKNRLKNLLENINEF